MYLSTATVSATSATECGWLLRMVDVSVHSHCFCYVSYRVWMAFPDGCYIRLHPLFLLRQLQSVDGFSGWLMSVGHRFIRNPRHRAQRACRGTTRLLTSGCPAGHRFTISTYPQTLYHEPYINYLSFDFRHLPQRIRNPYSPRP